MGATLGMLEADRDCLYLGLPSTMGWNKSAILGYLKDRVTKRLLGFESKLLSRAGKEVLVKTVAQSLSTYAMSVFLLPLELIMDIERLMNKFGWKTNNSEQKGITWMSWGRLCKHKNMGRMGFRNLRDFNLSMLGKQGWRILTQPSSLTAFKARYFPQGSFLTAKLGPNPSFIWRSILEAQWLLKLGIRWNIGTGEKINVLHEPWLPDRNPFVTTEEAALEGMKVANLVDPVSRSWNFNIIDALFNNHDCQLIALIPLEPDPRDDKLFCNKEVSGCYSVQSAYKLLQEEKGIWRAEEESWLWKSFRKLRIPPKIKNTVWRACSGCLPSLTQLRSRGVEVDLVCPLCCQDVETAFHCLVSCPAAQSVWHRTDIGTVVAHQMEFGPWFELQFKSLNEENRGKLAALCWSIWGARNEKVWNNRLLDAQTVACNALNYLDQWKMAQTVHQEDLTSGLTKEDGGVSWQAPPLNFIKVNVDGALFEEYIGFGIGIIARDYRGVLIAGRTRYFQGTTSPELVEASGIKEALSWIKDNSWHHVLVESDCLVAIQSLRNTINMPSRFGDIIRDCKSLLVELPFVKVYFVKRSANVAAHSIARASASYPDCTFDLGDIPIPLLPILVAYIES